MTKSNVDEKRKTIPSLDVSYSEAIGDLSEKSFSW